MVARAEAVVEHVRSGDRSAKLKAVREMKNQVVGSRTKKLQYLRAGAMPHLVAILAADSGDTGLVIQAATTLGSLAYNLEDGVLAILASGGLPQLLRQLLSPDTRVVEAAVRCLHFLLQSERVPREEVCSTATLERLVQLLGGPQPTLRQPAARVLAQTCSAAEQQNAAAASGAVSALMPLLRSGDKGQQEAAVAALAALTVDNECVTLRLVAEDGALPALLDLLHDRTPSVRLLAASCLTQLLRFAGLDESDEAPPRAVMSAFVKLLGEYDLGANSLALLPSLLASLISARPALLAQAADTDATQRLAELLHQCPASAPQAQQEGVLRALAVLMMAPDGEFCREQFMDANALPLVVACLGADRDERVQQEAANCVRALSRSAKDLRRKVADAQVAAPLVALLQSPRPAVQTAAAAALCNLVLEFSPVKEAVLREGGLPKLVGIAGAMEPELRLQGVWALQNLAYEAALDVKKALMMALPWSAATAVLSDPESEIQERALNLVRNLVHGKSEHPRAAIAWAADEGNPGSGAANLLAALAAPLQPEAPSLPRQREQALFAVCNICAGEEELQQAVMASAVPGTLTTHLASSERGVCEAASFCVINLAFDEAQPQAQQWVQELTRMGIPGALAALEANPASSNIRRNVATAMQYFPRPDQSSAMITDD